MFFLFFLCSDCIVCDSAWVILSAMWQKQSILVHNGLHLPCLAKSCRKAPWNPWSRLGVAWVARTNQAMCYLERSWKYALPRFAVLGLAQTCVRSALSVKLPIFLHCVTGRWRLDSSLIGRELWLFAIEFPYFLEVALPCGYLTASAVKDMTFTGYAWLAGAWAWGSFGPLLVV